MNLSEITSRILRQSNEPKRPLLFENYCAYTRSLELDPWQKDLCRRLEQSFWLANFDKFKSAFVKINIGVGRPYQITPSGFKLDQELIDTRATHGCRVAIHAPPQFGKSILISQCYPAWILGFDPLHRFRLSTYNVFHSARFSRVIQHLLRSSEHQELFPSVDSRIPAKCKVVEWSTVARSQHPDGQASFTALGLQSGFVGTGYDTLLMDDPYKSVEDALSDIIRDKTWRFWTDTASVRAQEHSNVFIMFHRYHQDDMGGRAVGSGDFELWRYAAEADGAYEDEASGLPAWPDPIGRKEGEYLSPRFGELYYLRNKKNEQVWYSQFQGRPSAKTGKMFNVSLMLPIHPDKVPPILHRVRAWDNAATESAGAFTAGVDMGIDAAENIYVFGVERAQVNTAEREILQNTTAIADGKLVRIHVPQDPGSAGKDVAFQFEQTMTAEGYLVTVTKVSGSKEMRAYPYSKAVNSNKVFLVLNKDGSVPVWHKPYKGELQYFPASTYKDQVDASADAYSDLMRQFNRGLVVKSAGEHNLLARSLFTKRFNSETILGHWEVAGAVHLAKDSSRPSGYCITARAAENAYLGEQTFVVAAARMYVDQPVQVLEAYQAALMKYCAKGILHPHVTWLNRDAGDVLQVTAHKMGLRLTKFLDEVTAGIPETNWYLQPLKAQSSFYDGLHLLTSRCLILVDDAQYGKRDIRDEFGMMSLRQDLDNWSYTELGLPQPHGGITLDCLRMTMYKFALSATSLTPEEKRFAQLPAELQPDAVRTKLGTPEFVEAHFAQQHALTLIRIKEEDEKREQFRNSNQQDHAIGPRAVTRRFSRRH